MSEWISVKERLPEDDDTVWVFSIKSGSWCAFHMGENRVMKKGWYRINDNNYSEEIKGVTHWMPLPEPPISDDVEESKWGRRPIQ